MKQHTCAHWNLVWRRGTLIGTVDLVFHGLEHCDVLHNGGGGVLIAGMFFPGLDFGNTEISYIMAGDL